MITKRENIAEYVLQMWQMEDLVRAFTTDEALAQNAFLADLKAMMQQEGVMEKGHVQVVQVAMQEMEEIHASLYDEEATYRAAWIALKPYMTLLKAKTDRPTMSDIEICLVFLYDIMLLRMQKKEISTETEAIQKQVSALLRYIAMDYNAQRQEE